MWIWIVLSLSAAGIITLMFKCRCSPGCDFYLVDEIVFDNITWSTVGIIGYMLLALGAILTIMAPVVDVPLALVRILATISGITTIRLIIKSINLDMFCPQCVFCWALNVAILVAAFRY